MSAGRWLVIIAIVAMVGVVAFAFYVRNEQRGRETDQRTSKGPTLSELLHGMDESQKLLFQTRAPAAKKNPNAGFVLTLLFGGVGAHHFYMGDVRRGVLYVLFVWTLIPVIVAFLELFTIRRKIQALNDLEEVQIAKDILGISDDQYVSDRDSSAEIANDQAATSGTADTLVLEIAALDAQYENGDVDEEEYVSKRREMKRELIEALKQESA